MSTASWIQPPCRYLPDRGGFSKRSCGRPKKFPSVVSSSSSSSPSSSSCSCGYSEISNFDFGNLASIFIWVFLLVVSAFWSRICLWILGFWFLFVHVYEWWWVFTIGIDSVNLS